jgi:hypothetical protein
MTKHNSTKIAAIELAPDAPVMPQFISDSLVVSGERFERGIHIRDARFQGSQALLAFNLPFSPHQSFRSVS